MKAQTALAALVPMIAPAAWQAAAAPYAPPVNLLSNPSFEQSAEGNEELAAGWSLYQCGYTRSRERSYAPDIDGPWSCRVSCSGNADEIGLGGTNTAIGQVPPHGTFAATNSIYVSSYTQGAIYGVYMTATYTDGTQKTFSFTLSDEQIAANLGTWKSYRLTFTTDPAKTLKTLTHWCLVWARGEQKFIGTVYFDAVELRQVPIGDQAEALLPFALASQADTAPRIDGAMDDECWRRSMALSPLRRRQTPRRQCSSSRSRVRGPRGLARSSSVRLHEALGVEQSGGVCGPGADYPTASLSVTLRRWAGMG